MNVNFLNLFITLIALNFGASYTFIKIINFKTELNIYKIIILLVTNLIISLFECFLKNQISTFSRIAFIIIIYSCFFMLLTKVKYSFSLLITVISFSFSYLISFIAILITSFIFMFIYYPTSSYHNIHLITVIIAAILGFALIYFFFIK